MKMLPNEQVLLVSAGVKISTTKLIGAIVGGAITGAIRGIPGGPIGMIGNAVAGAGLGAFTVAAYDAGQIYDSMQDDILYL
jgi:hypothetical protein